MILNRFCIDEDAAFELSGISSLKKPSRDWIYNKKTGELEPKTKAKGKEYSFIRSNFSPIHSININNR